MDTPDTIRKLENSQVEAFDTEYVEGGRWRAVKELIERDFPDGAFTLLDVGGGNGKFADRVLAHFPNATVTVLDNSESLLAKNTLSPRKTVVCDTVENLESVGKRQRFDIICLHWLLHHLVGDSHRRTTRHQLGALKSVRRLLQPCGRISVFENMYEGYIFPRLPGWTIYHLTATRAIAPFVRAMGANTAGVGVCFRSSGEWRRLTNEAGLRIADYAEPDDWIWPQKLAWRILLHLRSIRVGHMWLAADVSEDGGRSG
jgi:SAM-dependent methyltransferase